MAKAIRDHLSTSALPSKSGLASDADSIDSIASYAPTQPTSRCEPTFFSHPDDAKAQGQPGARVGAEAAALVRSTKSRSSSGHLPWHRAIAQRFSAERDVFRYILGLFLATRAVLIVIGVSAYTFIPKGYGKQIVWSNQPWLDIWGVWDSLWYMDIAQNGYSLAAKLPDYPDQTNFPFFPLYPLLMRSVSVFTGGDLFIAGVLVSNVCLLAACYLLYRLVALDWGDAIARRSIKYLLLFPVSFILSGVFTESLYLCLSLLCFYLAKKRRWWLAGLCGGLLSATRTLGILIAAPLLFEYAKSIRFKPKRLRLNALFVALIPIGLIAFSYYNYRVTGDFLFFKTNQAAWDREIMNPIVSFGRSLLQGFSEPSFKKLLECAFFAGAFGLLCASFKKIGFSYWLLGMYSIWIPLSAGVASMARFTLPIFPLFIALAFLSRKGQWNGWMTLSLGILQGALMAMWCTGQGLVI